MANIHLLKSVLYKLKRTYGNPVDLYKVTQVSINRETGEKVITRTVKHVVRSILLPARIINSFYTRYTTLRSRVDYVVGDREIIFACVDLGTYTFDSTDYVVYDNVRYRILDFQILENVVVYIHLREVQSEVPNNQQVNKYVSQVASDTQDAEGAL